jgi:hypothetical protein
MSKSQKAKQNFDVLCEEFFGPADRWGHYKFDINDGREYRIKLNKTSWRYEVKIVNSWKKLGGAYYTDPLGEGKLRRISEIHNLTV